MSEGEKQTAYESQAKRFEEHVKHFEQIDDFLEDFSRANGFALEKNQWHRPCRVLRRKGNPEQVIEITQEGDWKKVSYRDDLPHTITVVGQAVDEKQQFIYRMNEDVAYFVHFSTIQDNLRKYMGDALARLQKWTPDVILREGARGRHPLAEYHERGGLSIQTVE